MGLAWGYIVSKSVDLLNEKRQNVGCVLPFGIVTACLDDCGAFADGGVGGGDGGLFVLGCAGDADGRDVVFAEEGPEVMAWRDVKDLADILDGLGLAVVRFH